MKKKLKNESARKRKRRHLHIRHRVVGTAERPRVCVFRSNDHIYAQVVDDQQGRTLFSISSLGLNPPKAKDGPAEGPSEGKKKKKGAKKTTKVGVKTLLAKEVGRLAAEAAKDKGVTRVCFDRGGYLFHGRVKALADAMREGGLEF